MENPAACGEGTCAARQLCRGQRCSCKVWLLNGKTKFVFKQRIKEGRKRLLREACLLVPGGPQAELQNLLAFIICCNEAASGNKPPEATADGAGDMEQRDYSLSIESYPPPG